MLKGSWQTSTAGIGAILAALGEILSGLTDADPATPNWSVALAAIMAGIGLLRARDNGVTSEAAGAAK